MADEPEGKLEMAIRVLGNEMGIDRSSCFSCHALGCW